MLALDFEAYYDKTISLKELSPEAYAEKLFEIGKPPYLLAIYAEDQHFVGSPKDCPYGTFEAAATPPDRILAHNARFDKAMFKACVKHGLAPAAWLGSEWLCTADLAVFHQAPRNLKGAVGCLLGEVISKELRDKMSGKNYEDLKPEEQENLRQYCLADAKRCYQLAEKYIPSWPEWEREISKVNMDAGMHGVKLDVPFMERGVQKLHKIKFEAEKKLPWRNDPSADTAVLSMKEIVKLCAQAGISMPTRVDSDGVVQNTLAQSEPEVIAWEQEYGEKYPWVAAMRDYRKANILLKKLQTMQRHSVGNILYFSLLYFGAHTGRFSGSGGLNMQNLPGRKKSFVSLRHAIVARPGKEFCIIDWSQIEPRLLRWCVKDQVALDLLASGISIYEAYAIQHFKWVAGPAPLKEANKDLYGLAKAAVLGAGYGCGSGKYQLVAKNMAGIDLTPEEAANQISMFRASNPLVVGLWNRLIFAARMAASKHHDFELALPSGRKLFYFQPSLMNGLTAYTDRSHSKITFLHGGKLTENYIQAIARDVFALNMVRLAKAGIQNLFHVHDEYVLELDKGDHAEAEKRLRGIILEPIPWLKDCPLDIEIKWRTRYGGEEIVSNDP